MSQFEIISAPTLSLKFSYKSVQQTFYVYIQDSVENRKFVLLNPLGGLRENVGLSAQAMSKGRRLISIGRN